MSGRLRSSTTSRTGSRCERPQRLGAGADRDDAVALLLEVGPHERGEVLLVLDQQDAAGHAAILARPEEAQLGAGLCPLRPLGARDEREPWPDVAQRRRLPVDEHARLPFTRIVTVLPPDASRRPRRPGPTARPRGPWPPAATEPGAPAPACRPSSSRSRRNRPRRRRAPPLAIDEDPRLRADRHAHAAPIELPQHDRARHDRLHDTLHGLLGERARALRRWIRRLRRLARRVRARAGRRLGLSRTSLRRSRKRGRHGERADRHPTQHPRLFAHPAPGLPHHDHRSVLGA